MAVTEQIIEVVERGRKLGLSNAELDQMLCAIGCVRVVHQNGWLDRLLLRSGRPRALSDLRAPMRFRMARPNAVQPFYALIGKGSETGLAAPTTSIVPEIVPPDSISISP